MEIFTSVQFIGQKNCDNDLVKDMREAEMMIIAFSKQTLDMNRLQAVLDAEYRPYREELRHAGLSEEELRHMDPDDRVAALEGAHLDPYNYIYLACG